MIFKNPRETDWTNLFQSKKKHFWWWVRSNETSDENSRVPRASRRASWANLWVLRANFRVPRANLRVPIANMGPKSQLEGPKSHLEGLKSQLDGPKSQPEGHKSQPEGPKSQPEGPKSQLEGPKSQLEGPKTHVPQFCNSTGRGLGGLSEQAFERLHSRFNEFSKYKIRQNKDDPEYATSLLKCTVQLNSLHLSWNVPSYSWLPL